MRLTERGGLRALVARQREGFGFQMWITPFDLRVQSNLTMICVEVLKIRPLVVRQREGFGFQILIAPFDLKSSVQFDFDSCRGVENQDFGC